MKPSKPSIRHLPGLTAEGYSAGLCGAKTPAARSWGRNNPPGKAILTTSEGWRDDAVTGGRKHGAPHARCPRCVAALSDLRVLASLPVELPASPKIPDFAIRDERARARAYLAAQGFAAPDSFAAPEAPAADPGFEGPPEPGEHANGVLRQGYAAAVAVDGHLWVQFLQLAHAWARVALFDAKILPALTLVTPPSSARALADYCDRDPHGVRSLIRISPWVAGRGCARYLADVLLHEMVHAWCAEVEGDREPGYRGHGPKYTAKCNAIGAVLGLPKVFVKGRIPEGEAAAAAAASAGLGGEGAEAPDSARWPLCVRPADYYTAVPGIKPMNHAPKAPKAPREPSKPSAPSAVDPGAFAELAAALGALGAAFVLSDMEAASMIARQIRARLDAPIVGATAEQEATWKAQWRASMEARLFPNTAPAAASEAAE